MIGKGVKEPITHLEALEDGWCIRATRGQRECMIGIRVEEYDVFNMEGPDFVHGSSERDQNAIR